MYSMKRFAPVVVRISISLVIIWFGSQQLLHSAVWTGLIPAYVTNLSHLSALTVVHINGWFEITAGLLLLLGFYTRIIGFLLFLHILDIAFTVGVNTSIGVRDLGLTCAALSVFLHGPDGWCLDHIFDHPTT